MTDKKIELNDEELSKITGGTQTGAKNENGEVYINFPWPVTFLSGYYNRENLESLVDSNMDNISYIQPSITPEIKSAVESLYPNNDMPANVKTMLGIQ